MFEYLIQYVKETVSVEELNVLGRKGWELVSIVQYEEGYDYLFKRVLKDGDKI